MLAKMGGSYDPQLTTGRPRSHRRRQGKMEAIRDVAGIQACGPMPTQLHESDHVTKDTQSHNEDRKRTLRQSFLAREDGGKHESGGSGRSK